MTSLLNAAGDQGSDVMTLAWDDFAASTDLSAISLVKMDVEGAEFDLLPVMVPWLKARRPALYLSVHAPYLPTRQREKRVRDLFSALSFYGRVVETDGTPVSDNPVLDRFQTCLFTE